MSLPGVNTKSGNATASSATGAASVAWVETLVDPSRPTIEHGLERRKVLDIESGRVAVRRGRIPEVDRQLARVIFGIGDDLGPRVDPVLANATHGVGPRGSGSDTESGVHATRPNMTPASFQCAFMNASAFLPEAQTRPAHR